MSSRQPELSVRRHALQKYLYELTDFLPRDVTQVRYIYTVCRSVLLSQAKEVRFVFSIVLGSIVLFVITSL